LSPTREAARTGWKRLTTWAVVLIALHSAGVAVALLFFPRWGAALGGWNEVEPLFFARQVGIFHFVVAFVYVLEYFRYGRVTLLVLTKSTAVVFLGINLLVDSVPWVVPLACLGDGFMGFAVWWMARKAGVGAQGTA
jgi:hypothetical protein